jgi:hypothetical protein
MKTMSTSVTEVAERAPTINRSRRSLAFVAGGVALVGVTVATLAFVGVGSNGSQAKDGDKTATSLVAVTQQSLSSQTQVSGTLGYAGDYKVVNQAHGTVTALPASGQVVNQGEVLYRADGNPVVLLYGSTPAYRDLAAGPSASDVSGPDVQQLNADLVALGYASSDELDPSSDQFGWRTKQAVENLQAALGVDQTGMLGLGQVVFLPSALRVTELSATLGEPAQTGATILTGTSTTRVVSVALDPGQQSHVKVGDAVTVTLPDRKTTPGTVSSVGTVASTPSDSSSGGGGNGSDSNSGGGGNGSDSNPTIEVEITLNDPTSAGTLDQAPVLVSITTATVDSALVVPVTALVALSSGGYALEAVDPGGAHRLLPVTLGLFDDAKGLVQVNGSGVNPGQQVVVPST